MKKAFYIHGAFSAFKPDSDKVKNLSKSYDVVGVSYSMESTFQENMDTFTDFCKKNDVDVVVGTSLGGLYACELSKSLGIPSIMINPCVEPVMSLSTIIGTMTNFTTGKDETLTQEIVNTYPEKASVTKKCLIFLGMKDDLIDANKTISMFKGTASIVTDPNEDHYWEFFEANVTIESHINSVSSNASG